MLFFIILAINLIVCAFLSAVVYFLALAVQEFAIGRDYKPVLEYYWKQDNDLVTRCSYTCKVTR